MNTKRITLALVTLALLLITAQAALAKELGRVVINGPGLKTPIEITDHELANQFGLALLDDLDRQQVEGPAAPGEDFYTIDRGFSDEKGTVVGYDHVRYYPNPATGRGWFQFMGTDGYESKYEGVFFQASPAGEEALLAVLADHGVTFAEAVKPAAKVEPAKVDAPAKVDEAAGKSPVVEAEPSQVEAAPAAPPVSNLPLIIGGAIVLLLAVVAGAALARSRRTQKADG